jgi:methylmalonyl-CoA mutase N-terminal domain/subunit
MCPVIICGKPAVQEIAFSFSNAIAYLEAGLKTGLDIDSFAPRISWIFNTHNKLFEEVAKYRAARKVWADLLRRRFKAKDPRSWVLRFHTQTSGVSLTAQQPENNIIRVAYQVLAAVLGGAQSIAACSFDEALALPTEDSVRLDTVDPMGGSYFIEALTQNMIQEILRLIDQVDRMGGAVAAVEKGFFQREIESRAYAVQRAIEENKRIVVGVNKYQSSEKPAISLFKSNPEHAGQQTAKLQKLKEKRKQDQVNSSLQDLRKAAEGRENLMPCFMEAVRVYATLGEICGVLREVFGEYKPVEIVK